MTGLVDMDMDGLGIFAVGILRHGFQRAGAGPVEHFRIDVKRQPMRRLLPQLVMDDRRDGIRGEIMRPEIHPVFAVILGDESGGCITGDKVRPVERIDEEIAIGLGAEQGCFR